MNANSISPAQDTALATDAIVRVLRGYDDLIAIPRPTPPAKHLRHLIMTRLDEIDDQYTADYDERSPDFLKRRGAYRDRRAILYGSLVKINQLLRDESNAPRTPTPAPNPFPEINSNSRVISGNPSQPPESQPLPDPGITGNFREKPETAANFPQSSNTPPDDETPPLEIPGLTDVPPDQRNVAQRVELKALDRAYRQLAASRRVGRPSPFDDLSDDDKARICDLLESNTLAVVLKIIALPPPAGFGIKTSDSALQRFQENYLAKKQAAAEARARDLLEKAPDPVASFNQEFQKKLQLHLLGLNLKTSQSPNIIRTCVNALAKLNRG